MTWTISSSQTDSSAAQHKDVVEYWSLQSVTNVLFKCRSIRLQARSSADTVRYLGHTPITAQQRDELRRGDIFMERSHLFECYFAVILRLNPDRGSRKMTARGWLSLKVDVSGLYANGLAPRQCVRLREAVWEQRHERGAVVLIPCAVCGLRSLTRHLLHQICIAPSALLTSAPRNKSSNPTCGLKLSNKTHFTPSREGLEEQPGWMQSQYTS